MNTAYFVRRRDGCPAPDNLLARALFAPYTQIKGVWVFSASQVIGRFLSSSTLFLKVKLGKYAILDKAAEAAMRTMAPDIIILNRMCMVAHRLHRSPR